MKIFEDKIVSLGYLDGHSNLVRRPRLDASSHSLLGLVTDRLAARVGGQSDPRHSRCSACGDTDTHWYAGL